jgi:hypothetical protein
VIGADVRTFLSEVNPPKPRAHRTTCFDVLRYRVAVRRDPRLPAGVAQLVEQLIRNQQVVGSSPTAGSRQQKCPGAERDSNA